MRIGAHVGGCRATLLAALGYGWLAACGGSSEEPEGPLASGGSGNAGSGGASATGGRASASGGSPAPSGGSPASGGVAPASGGSVGGTGNEPGATGGSPTGGSPTGGVPNVVHRPSPTTCENHLPAVPRGDGGARATDGGVDCRTNADCAAKPYGQCLTMPQPIPGTYCAYGCVTDQNCGPNEVCECEEPVGRCVPGTCRTDGECPEGQLCVLSSWRNPCQGPDIKNYACGTGPSACGSCNVGGCGRPFLVEGAARVAEPAPRSDYADDLGPDTTSLSASERAALAAHWTEVGLMEHASVAAFARFTLQLLSFGAPSDLVEASNAALADELAHARLAFGLASAYGGRKVGPGALSMGRAAEGADFVETVRTAFLEACVGETCAALEAADARDAATDPAVRAALERIAADELRHAALGYRFVQWALRIGVPDVHGSLRTMLEGELGRLGTPRAALLDVPGTALTGHGLLPADVRAASRALAVRDVVLPAVRALLRGTDGAVAAAASAMA